MSFLLYLVNLSQKTNYFSLDNIEHSVNLVELCETGAAHWAVVYDTGILDLGLDFGDLV